MRGFAARRSSNASPSSVCESRDVDEYVLPSTIPSDEAEALIDIEPFHGALGAPVALTWFAQDSLQEGSGFELSVPVRQAKLTRSCR
jgi:hypothetical protein